MLVPPRLRSGDAEVDRLWWMFSLAGLRTVRIEVRYRSTRAAKGVTA